MVSHDVKLSALRVAQVQKFVIKLSELSSKRLLPPLGVEDSTSNTYPPRFSLDDKGLVYQVIRDGGHTLIYQPLDGGASRTILTPVSESLPDFAWSPSGKELAVIRQKSSSDVVLIRDLDGK